MAVEAKRGCGFRKVGGLYVIGGGPSRDCGRLPLPLHICPTCGGGVKQTRGWTWINPGKLFAETKCKRLSMCDGCPMAPERFAAMERAGLLWIGKSFYPTPVHFLKEADAVGICRRITAIPKGLVDKGGKLTDTWIFLAHPEAVQGRNDEGESVMQPGVFRVFKPTRIEKIVTETEAEDLEEMEKLKKRGILPVAVPDDDSDHRGSAYDKDKPTNGALL